VTEVHWRIIANLAFKYRSHFTAHWVADGAMVHAGASTELFILQWARGKGSSPERVKGSVRGEESSNSRGQIFIPVGRGGQRDGRRVGLPTASSTRRTASWIQNSEYRPTSDEDELTSPGCTLIGPWLRYGLVGGRDLSHGSVGYSTINGNELYSPRTVVKLYSRSNKVKWTLWHRTRSLSPDPVTDHLALCYC